MAKLKKRPDGYYRKTFTFQGRQYTCYARSTRLLDEKVQEKKEQLKKGLLINTNPSLDEYFEVWYAGRDGTVKESTQLSVYKRYQSISKFIGSMKIKDISAATCRELQNKLKKDHIEQVLMVNNPEKRSPDDGLPEKIPKKFQRGQYTTTGINIRLTLLHTILRQAVADRLLEYNPVDGLKGKKRAEKKARDGIHRALTQEELKVFFDRAKGNCRHYNLMRLLLHTGMRAGEACALKWSDIDRKNNCIHVTKTVERTGNRERIISGTPKNDSSNRSVPLTPLLLQILDDQKRQNEAESGGKVVSISGLIFRTDKGGIAEAVSINNAIHNNLKALEKQGKHIDHFTAHCFRDTFATFAVDGGMRPQTLQRILGHANINLTMNLYYHLQEKDKQSEMQQVSIPV